jgi:sec-independent protein translocase protein TatB
MFDIGFTELVVIGLVALIVIGPERLPRVARTVGHLLGRLQRYVADVRADINREMELEELRKMRDSVQQAATSFESSVQSELSKAESELNRTAESVTDTEAAPAPEVSPAREAAPAIGEKPEAPVAATIDEKAK